MIREFTWAKGEDLGKGNWRVFVCHTCKRLYWHPLSWCQTCPGKLIRLVGPTEELQEHLYGQGYTESGI